MKTHYTLGFLFSNDFKKVVLIKKKRPTWQAGRLNGVGGHMEEGERPEFCMYREFHEEIWYNYLSAPTWKEYARLDAEDFVVDCFATTGQVDACNARTDEEIVIIDTELIHSMRIYDMVENVPWLVSMAIDFLKDGRPSFATIKYE